MSKLQCPQCGPVDVVVETINNVMRKSTWLDNAGRYDWDEDDFDYTEVARTECHKCGAQLEVPSDVF